MDKKTREKLKILHVASELAPFAKVGGLGDVIGSLPKAIQENYNVDIRIIIPLYKIIDCKKWQLEKIIDSMKIKLPNNKNLKIDVFKSFIPETKIPIYFIDMPTYFFSHSIYIHDVRDRDPHIHFIYFSWAVLEIIRSMDWLPDVINVHSWQGSMIPKWIKSKFKHNDFFRTISTVLTIHFDNPGEMDFKESKNLGLKQQALKEPFHINHRKKISVLGEGILNADMINTVSPTYAHELLTKKGSPILYKIFQQRKKYFTGILNGIDYSNFDPRFNDDTPVKYWTDSIDKKVKNKLFLQKKVGLIQAPDLPLVSVVSRLTEQKGIDLIDEVIENLMDMGAQFIILGSGRDEITKIFIKKEKKFPKFMEARLKFDANFAQTIYAGSDMLLMPSRFEPCGLSQIIAMRFGTLPIVRKTGGLADTVCDGYDGFVFRDYDKDAFLVAIRRAVDMYYNQKDHWRKMQIQAMKKDFSWKTSAKKYIWLYKKAISNHKAWLKEQEEKNAE